MIWGEKTESKSGLYLLEPYDPNRIPVVFVHGLLSSGYTWLNVSNAVRADPEIRRRYQVWAFFYPTGNPILYSALRLREDLALAQKKYGLKHGIVLVGHSMGAFFAGFRQRTSVRQIGLQFSMRVQPSCFLSLTQSRCCETRYSSGPTLW